MLLNDAATTFLKVYLSLFCPTPHLSTGYKMWSTFVYKLYCSFVICIRISTHKSLFGPKCSLAYKLQWCCVFKMVRARSSFLYLFKKSTRTWGKKQQLPLTMP